MPSILLLYQYQNLGKIQPSRPLHESFSWSLFSIDTVIYNDSVLFEDFDFKNRAGNIVLIDNAKLFIHKSETTLVLRNRTYENCTNVTVGVEECYGFVTETNDYSFIVCVNGD